MFEVGTEAGRLYGHGPTLARAGPARFHLLTIDFHVRAIDFHARTERDPHTAGVLTVS